MRRSAAKPIDALVLLARASGGRRKRQSFWALVILAALFLVFGSLFTWWFWPVPPSGPLILALYDQVTLPGRRCTLTARVSPLNPAETSENLAGCEVWFDQPQAGLLGRGVTDARGLATLAAEFPISDQPLTLTARYAGDKRRQRRGLQAYGRVFAWPAESQLLIVDADHALAELDAEEFFAAHPLDVRPKPGVLDALCALRSRFRLVYLTGRGASAFDYAKMRAWLESSSLPARQFPDGAILTGAGEAAADPHAVRKRVLSELRMVYGAKALGVTTSVEVARCFSEEHLETYLLGKGHEPPTGVVAVADWRELAGRIKP